jgi:predicted nucleic acid-binding protein
MLVVSNTSPVSNLAIIGRLGLLQERYESVLIPPAVKSELDALTHPGGKNRVEEALRAGWLKVEPLPAAATALALPVILDPGEIEAIQLGRHLSADKLILDDALARTAARALGLKFTGLLGELVFAKNAGTVPLVKAEITRLRTEARFFVSAEVEAAILAGAGE